MKGYTLIFGLLIAFCILSVPVAAAIEAHDYNTGNTTNSATLRIYTPDSVAAGDLLLAQITFEIGSSENSIIAPSGWTFETEHYQSEGVWQAIYSRVAGATEPAYYEWTYRVRYYNPSAGGYFYYDYPTNSIGTIIRITGADTTGDPILGSTSRSDTVPGDDLTANGISSVPWNSLLVGFFGFDGFAALTTPTTMTQTYLESRTADAGPTILAATQVWGGGDTSTRTSYNDIDDHYWVASLVAVKSAVACTPTGADDTCNGIDEDCDGTADEHYISASCDGADADLCVEGTMVCSVGLLVCNDPNDADPDLCDTLDNDCNPATADGSGDSRVGASCDGTDADLCGEGLATCNAGSIVCSDPNDVDLEVCDGLDNDCNPATVDGSGDSRIGNACDGTDADLCIEGTAICSAGSVVCNDPNDADPDLCDALDNDCNPATEDGSSDPQYGQTCDGSDADLCAEGSYVCSGAGSWTCTDANDVDLEVCDGLDNDCNPATADGSGDSRVGNACDGTDADLCAEGLATCNSGSIACNDANDVDQETCNGLDDDCNGLTDEKIITYLGSVTNQSEGSSLPMTLPTVHAGDFLIAQIAFRDDTAIGAITPPDGWSALPRVNNGDATNWFGHIIYYRTVAADATNQEYTFTFPQDLHAVGGIIRYTGVGGIRAYDYYTAAPPSWTLGAPSVSFAPTSRVIAFYSVMGDLSSFSSIATVINPPISLDTVLSNNNNIGHLTIKAADKATSGLPTTSTYCTIWPANYNIAETVVLDAGSACTAADVCDGVDNDNNPSTSDGSADPQYGQVCDGSDADLCKEGSYICSGASGWTCSDANDADPDVCNGLDDDCNPATADGSAETDFNTACDGTDADLCAEGIWACSGGPGLTCTDANDVDVEVCDGLDNDCNTLIDDGLTAPNANNQHGVCAGSVKVCSGTGGWVEPTYPITQETCDSLDNDCNGLTDDQSIVYHNAVTNAADGSSLTMTLPTVHAGDFLIAQIAFRDDTAIGAIATPEGWSALPRVNHDDSTHWFGQIIYYRTAAADATNQEYTFTFPQELHSAGGITRYTGVGGILSSGYYNMFSAGQMSTPSLSSEPGSRLVVFDTIMADTSISSVATSDGSHYIHDLYLLRNPGDLSIRAGDEAVSGTSAPATYAMAGGSALNIGEAVVLDAGSACTVPTEICDGIDNDGDGSADEDFTNLGDTCSAGLGACAASGVYVCTADHTGTACNAVAGTPAPSDTTCNGIDEDCDGTIDEDYVPIATTCGTGACAAAGKTYCVDGDIIDSCMPGTPTAEVCDGLDNDCDWTIDEDNPGGGAACDGADSDLCAEGVVVCAAGSLACSDDSESLLDVCDGIDNDCDPTSADGSEDTGSGVTCNDGDACSLDSCDAASGGCVHALITCDDGDACTTDSCDLETGCTHAPMVCDDGNWCNGAETCDHALGCQAGAPPACDDGVGCTVDACNEGTDSCMHAADNAACDNGLYCDGAETCSATLGCQAGAPVDCADGSLCTVDACNEAVDACVITPISCDDSDACTTDSCDPAVGCIYAAYEPIACDGTDADQCAEGVTVCTAGSITCTDANDENLEICDGADNDCDPATSDGSADPQYGQTCDGTDADLCTEGVTICSAGSLVCDDPNDANLELCNNLDDDCNPATADGAGDSEVGATCDGIDSDLCMDGVTVCDAGAVTCTDATDSILDVCDGADNDCDPASVDGAEDSLVGVACDGTDADLCTEGEVICSSGSLVCTDDTGDSIEIFNSVDDDCNGIIDDGLDAMMKITNGSQTVQCSDKIDPITLTATNIPDDFEDATITTEWNVNSGSYTPGLPSNLMIEPDDLHPEEIDTDSTCVVNQTNALYWDCSWKISGSIGVPAGIYTVKATINEHDSHTPNITATITVRPENATCSFDDDNPVSVRVISAGGNSGPFYLLVDVKEKVPDLPAGYNLPGDIELAQADVRLDHVGSGGSISAESCTNETDPDGYDAIKTFNCTFSGVPVDTYTVAVAIDGDGYYTGSCEDVLVVYDPSLGFTTGGGTFLWKGDETNFGYTMKYNKKSTNIQGNLLLIRHHWEDGIETIYRVKSNALYGLALGENTSVPMGWASFSGKSTYFEPGMSTPEGNHEFMVYVEDRDNPGTGRDRFWIKVDGGESMSMPAEVNAISLIGGNIVVPHKSSSKGSPNGGPKYIKIE